MANEFKNTLIAGAVAVALVFIFYTAVSGSQFGAKGAPTGNFLAKNDNTHVILVENKWASSTLFPIAEANGTIKDGLLSGQNALSLPFKSEQKWFGANGRGIVILTVRKADSGEVVMLLDGQQIYRDKATVGTSYVQFDKSRLTGEDTLEIRAAAPLLGSSSCDVNAEIKGEITSVINGTFQTPAKYRRAVLVMYTSQDQGKLTVRVNGNTLYEDMTSGTLDIGLENLKAINTIEFVPETGGKHLIEWAEVRFE